MNSYKAEKRAVALSAVALSCGGIAYREPLNIHRTKIEGIFFVTLHKKPSRRVKGQLRAWIFVSFDEKSARSFPHAEYVEIPYTQIIHFLYEIGNFFEKNSLQFELNML